MRSSGDDYTGRLLFVKTSRPGKGHPSGLSMARILMTAHAARGKTSQGRELKLGATASNLYMSRGETGKR